MEKIKKQLAINVVLVVLSVLVIVVAQMYKKDDILLNWSEYLDSEIVFVMITSLGSTIGWRFSESIVGHWLYNIFIGVVIIFFAIEYGVAIAGRNNILIIGIGGSLIIFVILYIIENLIIIFHFRNIQKSENGLGYQEEEVRE